MQQFTLVSSFCSLACRELLNGIRSGWALEKVSIRGEHLYTPTPRNSHVGHLASMGSLLISYLTLLTKSFSAALEVAVQSRKEVSEAGVLVHPRRTTSMLTTLRLTDFLLIVTLHCLQGAFQREKRRQYRRERKIQGRVSRCTHAG